MRAAALGDNCIDLYPRLGRWYCTGNAVDFAVHLQRLGVPTSIVSVTGEDAYGRAMVETLAGEGLDVSHLRVQPGPTAVCSMDLAGRERVHNEYVEGVMKDVVFTPDDIAFAAAHDLVHSAFWGHADHHLAEVKGGGALVSFDYATEWQHSLVAATIPHVDYAFFSFDEPSPAVELFLREVVAVGPQAAIATFGELGSMAWDGRVLTRCGIVPANVTNTVGCGDSFIAGFMYGVLQQRSMGESLWQGARVAAEVVATFGPWPERVPEAAE
jgi:fructoselysine 6-kinase